MRIGIFSCVPFSRGGSTPAFEETNCVGDGFQFPWHLGRHIPSSRIDLGCAVCQCVQTMERLPTLGIFNVGTDLKAGDCAQRVHKHRVYTESWPWEKKIPCRTRESNQHQQHARPDPHPTELHSHPDDKSSWNIPLTAHANGSTSLGSLWDFRFNRHHQGIPRHPLKLRHLPRFRWVYQRPSAPASSPPQQWRCLQHKVVISHKQQN